MVAAVVSEATLRVTSGNLIYPVPQDR
jgi:hypothetical protein